MSVWNWTWNCTVLIRLNPNLDHTHTHTHGLPDAYIFSLSLLLSNQTCCQLKMTMKWNVQWKEALQLWCGLPFSFRCRNFRWIFMRMNRVALSWKLLSLLIKKKKVWACGLSTSELMFFISSPSWCVKVTFHYSVIVSQHKTIILSDHSVRSVKAEFLYKRCW